ncbi:hypothetical protein Srot_1671 [Segniliparus rotundus DSM 44985]|uniref:Lipoprotein n=1 Tax=Segniliparus rotundus (strain ATCC BAA-972 / CDC 1076 / CIP 108378 / DSM 44985 / JCM 13578) TaxID=640132 RepID=D6Z852_SEGRD|nr:hypothetical protein [Segniliparus rotundus]ADG98132.1 hypothetical protein Srot_1671 [Segniliparus rotundus DSM 44985]
MKAQASVFLALALMLVGCSTKQPSAASSSRASSAAAAPTLGKGRVVTPEDVGKEPLRLRLGEPVTYQRDGVSITLAPTRLEKLNGTPEGFEGQIIDCGSWWRVTETWVIDVKPDTTWRSWRRDFQGVFGLFGEAKDPKYGFYSEVATSAISKNADDLDRALGDAERAWKFTGPLHFEKTGPQYLAGCKLNVGPGAAQTGQQFVPDERPLTELEIVLPAKEGQNPREWPTLAIWKV